MPNIAVVLKSEISRIARKELRAEIDPVRKALTAAKKEIAALKKRQHSYEKVGRSTSRSPTRPMNALKPDMGAPNGHALKRFGPKGLISLRRRLGLSAEELGRLVQTSAQSIYNWEGGKVRPRERQQHLIASLRGVGKKEVAARLATLSE